MEAAPPFDQHSDGDDDDPSQKLSAAQRLPRYILLKSKYNDKYLRQVDEHQAPRPYRIPSLQYTGPNNEKKLDIQFEIEVAKSNQNMVHIRSLRNNRYWQIYDVSSMFVTATAKKPEENTNNSECTLFEPIVNDAGHNSYWFKHAFGNYVSMSSDDSDCRLHAKKEEVHATDIDLHIVIDSESILLLPKFIALKGHNNKYIKPYSEAPSKSFMAFAGDDITDVNVPNEVCPGDNGVIRLKNTKTGQYWSRTTIARLNAFVLSDRDDPEDSRTWFTPEKISNKIIALRHRGMYCRSVTQPDNVTWFCALGNRPDKSVLLEVEEPVLYREILDVEFNGFKSGRIYNEKSVLIAHGEAVNRSKVGNEMELSVKFTDSMIRNWSHNASLKLATSFSLKAAAIPYIADGGVTVSGETSAAKDWGEISEGIKKLERSRKVTVAAGKTTKLTVIATQGWCDVPYTYTQKDTLISGQEETKTLDGVYKGANVYNLQWLRDDS